MAFGRSLTFRPQGQLANPQYSLRGRLWGVAPNPSESDQARELVSDSPGRRKTSRSRDRAGVDQPCREPRELVRVAVGQLRGDPFELG